MEIIFPFAMFLMLGLGAIYLLARRVPNVDQEWMRSLMVAALVLRLLAATAFALFSPLRVFHEDASGYEHMGMLIASVWHGDYPPLLLDTPNAGFVYLAGALYFVFGRYEPVLSYFNCIIGTVLVFFVYRLAIRFFHPKVARLSALLVGLVPSMILWSSVALKDVSVTLALVIALSSCVALKERVNVAAVLGIVLPVVAIQTIRFYMTYFVGFAIIVSLVLDRGTRFITGIYKQLFLVAMGVGLFVMLGMTDTADRQLDYFSLEYASNYRRGMAITANSGFDVDVDVSTPGSALAYLPIGMANLLWAPFPWQWVSLRPLLAAPETILWWALFPATMRGLILAIRRRFTSASALLIFTATITCAYSLIHGNVGSAFRQRAQILVFLFIFSAAGIYMKKLTKAGLDPALVLVDEDPMAAGSTAAPITTPTASPAGALTARAGGAKLT